MPVVFLTPQVPIPIGAGATVVRGLTTPLLTLGWAIKFGSETAARGM